MLFPVSELSYVDSLLICQLAIPVVQIVDETALISDFPIAKKAFLFLVVFESPLEVIDSIVAPLESFPVFLVILEITSIN